MAHALFSPEIKFLLQENDAAGMKEFCESLHPATVSEALVCELPVDQIWRFLKHTNIKNQAAIFEYLPIDVQVEMVEGTGREHMAELIKMMSHDDRGDLIRRLMPKVSESLMRLVDEADRRDIATLVNQEPNTAGALMTTDYAWLPPGLSASEALDRLRLQAPETETIYYIFILDEQHRLTGVLSLRDLILAPRHQLIRDLMENEVVCVRASDDREKVAKTMAQFDLIAMPVVDDQNRMVGIITHDDIMDVVVQEATEDVHRMGAVAPITEAYLETSFVTVWSRRSVWLACLFVGGIFTVIALARFQNAIATVALLTLFIPLCISTGGNSGSQAATLITRALALGQVSERDWLRVLRHEVLMGFALGLSLGLIGFVLALITHAVYDHGAEPAPPAFTFGFVIFQAVVLICIWGTIVGSMLPLIFRKIGADPGVASSPFVATFVDVTGVVIYFTIASVYLL